MRRTKAGALVVLLTVICALGPGCHSECGSIAPGTPAADLPLGYDAELDVGNCSTSSGSSDELRTLACCTWARARTDAGADLSSCVHGKFDCSNVGVAEARYVGDGYSGWECGEYGPVTYLCIAWIRDQKVVGTCSGCPPD